MPASQPLITTRTVTALGFSQLVLWGISYYLIGALGERMVADLGWERTVVYGGFSSALVVMGVVSPLAGQLIDRFGGRPVMSAGALLIAVSCAALAASHTVWSYYAAWLCMGLAMRLTLYDAAFATLARLGGPTARRSISQITLLGGLASTAFWPIGFYLAELLGWRGAVWVYAGIALLTLPLHLTLPRGRYAAPEEDWLKEADEDSATPAASSASPVSSTPSAQTTSAQSTAAQTTTPSSAEEQPASAAGTGKPPGTLVDQFLYAALVMLTTFLNSGISAHMIGMLTGLGVGAALAVWISTLRGIGQSSARLAEVLFGRRLHPLTLAILAAGFLPAGFVAGLFSGQFVAGAVVFAVLYGAANGLLTIVRGALPLVLFDHRIYGRLVGRLLVPSFPISAFAPLAFALVVERYGNHASMVFSILVAGLVFACALTLRLRHRI